MNAPIEIEVAAEWWSQQIDKEQLTAEQVQLFKENFIKLLQSKFEGHWYPGEPSRGNGFRSLLCDNRNVDKIVLEAARQAYIGNILKRLGERSLIMWIDPGQVEVKFFTGHKRDQIPLILYPKGNSKPAPDHQPRFETQSTPASPTKSWSSLEFERKARALSLPSRQPFASYDLLSRGENFSLSSYDEKGFVNNTIREGLDASCWQRLF
eukprot:TRINITY_DN4208_c0_g1_i1.p1 TRINITY_DN4208_c0_g1~~TRINITY_DN4208_c0_g1_i1.p1  ORF type:complete len:209 (+),score=39.36 TRINITY_DN4208_c0_g1_i1:69-695(+)